MSTISQLNSEAAAAKARNAAMSSVITRRIVEEFDNGDYYLNIVRNWGRDRPLITIWICKHTWTEHGSPDDISLIATEIQSMQYQHSATSILYTSPSRTWDIRLEHTYSQKLTADELELLDCLGKIVKETSSYNTIICR